MGDAALLAAVIELALEAGRRIQKHYNAGSVDARQKPDRSPVTAADLDAEACILKGLKDLDPGVPVVSEESSLPSREARRGWRRFWLVDPLDGTKEFLGRTGDFTVNIARIEDGEPVLGVVYAPALDRLYFAENGSGAWKREGEGGPIRIYSEPRRPPAPWRIAESRSHPSEELERFLRTLPVGERISIGSSLKFCLVAEGRADLYPRFGPTMEWDTAAGDCIYRASGREGPRLSPLTYNKPDMKNGAFLIGADASLSSAAPGAA